MTLSPRQLQVIEGAATGASDKEIALQLGIARETVKAHFSAAFERMGARNRTHAVAKALKEGLIH